MKRYVYAVLVIFFLALAVSPAVGGEPYAPKVEPPAGIKVGTPEYLGVMSINAAQVPHRSSVGVPPYPGARIVMTRGTSKMKANDVEYTCLQYLKMYAPDDGEKVASFFKEKLTDYKFKSEFGGMIRAFWKGPDDINTLDITQMCTTPNVLITEATDSERKLMPGAKSVIEIGYEPVK